MTTETQTLIASLAATQNDVDGVYLDQRNERYFDWSTIVDTGTSKSRMFEVSNGVDTVQITLGRAEMLRVHAALTLTLLADKD